MLIDTDVLIWAARGSAEAQQTLDDIDQPSISVVTVIELMQGARNANELRQIEQGLAGWGATVLPIDAPISTVARNLVREYALSNGLQLADALVAASAIQHQLTLMSGNRKHFETISDLAFQPFVR